MNNDNACGCNLSPIVENPGCGPEPPKESMRDYIDRLKLNRYWYRMREWKAYNPITGEEYTLDQLDKMLKR